MKTKEEIINTWTKDVKANGYDNPKDWKYIIKRVRKRSGIKGFARTKKLPEFLTLDEVTLILNTAYTLQTRKKNLKRGLIVETLLKTGLRNAELCALRVENIDFNTGVFKVVEGKGNKDRMGLMPKSLLHKLLIYLDGRKMGYLFINERGVEFSTRSIQYIMEDIRKETNLNKHITPHSLRHTFATILINEGIDIRKIQKLLGHSDISTTQLYTHVLLTDMKEEVQRITNNIQ